MKVAIIDHMVNYGGGSRVLRNLLPAIKKMRPEWKLTFYANMAAIKRDGLQEELSPYLTIKGLRSITLANLPFLSKIKGAKMALTYFQRNCQKLLSPFPYFFSGSLHKEIHDLSSHYDLLFCPWPYLIQCPQLAPSIPVVSIFHDFNFRYYFNGPTFHPLHQQFLNHEIPRWLRLSTPVVSTYFMKRELEKFYPEFGSKTEVIHLSALGAETTIDPVEAKKIVNSLGIATPYLLYPTNTSCHKNIGNLLSAFYLLEKKYPSLKLILAGFGTEAVNGKPEPFGLQLSSDNRTVIGLGYVTNRQIDALIQCAEVVISTSLYEAGCGPGLDAWNKGVPVAMSNIPPFTEHIEVQGVRAQLFDPQSPSDIAHKIEAILSHPEQAKKEALYSQQKLGEYNWNCVAQKYIRIFEKAAHDKNPRLSTLSTGKREKIPQ